MLPCENKSKFYSQLLEKMCIDFLYDSEKERERDGLYLFVYFKSERVV